MAVHADSSGEPGAKLFDLVSPDNFAVGPSFFEAPPDTRLLPDTSYVLVWSHLSGTLHRLVRTSSDSEDSIGLRGYSIADAFYLGADTDNLAVSQMAIQWKSRCTAWPRDAPSCPAGTR